jgi:hypothetical protein
MRDEKKKNKKNVIEKFESWKIQKERRGHIKNGS